MIPPPNQFNGNFSNQLMPNPQTNQQIRALIQQTRNQDIKNSGPTQQRNQYQYRSSINNNNNTHLNNGIITQQRAPNITLNSNDAPSNQTETVPQTENVSISQKSSQAGSNVSPNSNLALSQETTQISDSQNEIPNNSLAMNSPAEQIVVETNLKYYLDLDENKDELDIVSSTKTALLNSIESFNPTNNTTTLLDDFLDEQVSKFDFVYNLRSIKNPIQTKYEHEMKQNSTFEMNKNENKLFNFYTQNDAFKTLFDENGTDGNEQETAESVSLDEKAFNLIEKLSISLNKSMGLFFHLFASNSFRLNKLSKLIIQLILSENTQNEKKEDAINQENEWSLKIKKIKLGLRLANLILVRYNKTIASSLIDLKLQEHLLNLVVLNSSVVFNESMRLKCLNSLYMSIQFEYGIKHFLTTNSARLVDYFLLLKQTTSKSRLVVAITQILLSCKFYESLKLFSSKCHSKFVLAQTGEPNEKFDQEILNLFEYIYIYCVRSLKLNKTVVLAELKKNDQSNSHEENSQTADESKINKKFKANDSNDLPADCSDQFYEYAYNDDLEAKFNKLPFQNLFDKFPSEYVEAIQSQSMHVTILKLCDSLEILKYILMLFSYVYDQLKKNTQNKRLIYLKSLINKFLDDLYNVSELNSFSFVGIEYLLNNCKLTKCLLRIMLNKSNNQQTIKKLNFSLQAVSSISSLQLNLDQLAKNKFDSIQIETIFLDSLDKLQSLAFLLNSPDRINYNLTLVECLCSPDGNMSNKYVFCLLNWLELTIVEEHFNELIAKKDESTTLNSIRCYILNSLTEIFYILCKTNKNWNLPYFTNDPYAESIILTLNKKDEEFILNDYCLCLKRLNQYVCLFLNSLSSIRIKSQSETNLPAMNSNTITNLIYKLKIIKSCIEPIILTRSSTNLTNQKASFTENNKLATSLANMSGYYFKINYLNSFIDLFRRTIDKNLNLYFLKQYHTYLIGADTSSDTGLNRRKITNEFLNSNITILNILKNLCIFKSIEINLFDLFQKSKPNSFSLFNTDLHVASLKLAKYSLDLNEQFNSKRYLGHLISRNFLIICLNFLNKLSDYLLYYAKPSINGNSVSSAFSTQSLDLEQFNMIISLVDPVVHLIKTILSKLIRIRGESFTDTSALPILFRFSGIFNFCIQQSLSLLKKEFGSDQKSSSARKISLLKSNRLLFNQLISSYDLINKNLINTFVAFTQPILSIQDRSALKSSLFTCLYRELAKYTIEKPFNFFHGLKLLSELLPLPLPIPLENQPTEGITKDEDSIMLNERRVLSDHLEPLFKREKLKKFKIFDLDNEKYAPTLIGLIKTLSISSNKTKVNSLLKRVCLQISDLSDKMCTHLLKCLLEYAMDLLARLKDDNYENDDDSNEEFTEEKNLNQNCEEKLASDNIFNEYEDELGEEEPIDELLNQESEKINGLINEIIESHVQNGTEVIKENEIDSLYDTEIEETIIKTSCNESLILKPPENSIALNNEQSSLDNKTAKTANIEENPSVNETNDSEIKEHYKRSIIASFSRLIKFICSLLAIERNEAEINPIRIKLIHLLTESSAHKISSAAKHEPKKIKNLYLKFMFDCIKYCNQIDLPTKKDLK